MVAAVRFRGSRRRSGRAVAPRRVGPAPYAHRMEAAARHAHAHAGHPYSAPEALDECPRCGESLEDNLREVHLVVLLDDGAEHRALGHECRLCGWCCAPEV